jgi:large subunit ribosomal protein LP0
MTDRKEIYRQKAKKRKEEYFPKLTQLCNEYNKVFVVTADNVGSTQMQQIRFALRGTGVVLMGKNTMIRKALRGLAKENPKLEKLIPWVKNNVGFVFTKGDLKACRTILLANKVAAPARVGAVSPVDVVVPASNTGMEPTKTSFFQALNIPTKITKGTVEIMNDVQLIKAGEKVGGSEATLLQMLNIKPFFYGLQILAVYDNGSVFDSSVLDITDEILTEKFRAGVANVAALSLAIGRPCEASIPYSITAAFRDIISLGLAGLNEYSFPQLEAFKKAAAAGPAPTAPSAPAAKKDEKPAAAAPKKKEPEPEPEDDVGMGGLFD